MAVSSAGSLADIIERRVSTLSRQLASFCGSPRSLLDKLTENNLITGYLEAVDKIDVLGVSDYDKVSRLLTMVIVQVSSSTSPEEVVHRFLCAIEDVAPSMVDITKEMLKELECSIHSMEGTHKDSLPLQKNKHSSLAAVHKLRYEYAKFILKLKQMLKSKRVPLRDLKQVWSNISEKRHGHPAMKCNTIDKFIEVVSNDGQLPALQYQYLEKLADTFLEGRGRQLIKEYEHKIKQCLKNQISCGVKQLKVKVNIGYHQDRFLTEADESSVYYVKETLAKVFQFYPEEIVLVSVRPGCIELTYIAPLAVTSAILSSNKSQIGHSLLEHNIQTISIDGSVIWNQKTEEPSKSSQKDVAIDMPEVSASTKSPLSKMLIPSLKPGPMRGTNGCRKNRKTEKCSTCTCTLLKILALLTLVFILAKFGLSKWIIGITVVLIVLVSMRHELFLLVRTSL